MLNNEVDVKLSEHCLGQSGYGLGYHAYICFMLSSGTPLNVTHYHLSSPHGVVHLYLLAFFSAILGIIPYNTHTRMTSQTRK